MKNYTFGFKRKLKFDLPTVFMAACAAVLIFWGPSLFVSKLGASSNTKWIEIGNETSYTLICIEGASYIVLTKDDYRSGIAIHPTLKSNSLTPTIHVKECTKK